MIEFPVEGLNLSQYVMNNKEGGKNSQQNIYDLYSISNHYGSLNGGHYTAFAQNPVNKKWYEFDDTDVSKADSGKVVSKAAYVLFYKLRKNGKK